MYIFFVKSVYQRLFDWLKFEVSDKKKFIKSFGIPEQNWRKEKVLKPPKGIRKVRYSWFRHFKFWQNITWIANC